MAPSTRTTALVALAFSSQCLATASPKVLSMPITQATTGPYQPLSKRDPVSLNVANNVSTMYYLASASVGTPPQQQLFILDTGSSDVWMFAPGVCEDSDQDDLTHSCGGYSFNAKASSSYHLTRPGDFYISYGDGSEATGDYFTDNLQFGGTTINNLTMAVANETDGNFFGIMGIGYRANEASVEDMDEEYDPYDSPYSNSTEPPVTVDGDRVNGTTNTTYTLLDQMVANGLIKTQAYSLWLDDLVSSTGSILFGGVDHAKYSGDLITVPVETEEGAHLELLVEWSSLGLTDQSGSTLLGVNTSFPGTALLDSGTPWITVPDDVYTQLTDYFASTEDEDWGTLVSCSIIPSHGTLDFAFSGPNGPVIAVPFSELALPLYVDETPLLFNDGSAACQLAIESNSGDRRSHARHPCKGKDSPDDLEMYVLGAPFMRSAYLVFDLAHNQVSMAQTNFSAGAASQIAEIASNDTSNAVPGVTRTASESFVAPTPTDGGYYSEYGSYYSQYTDEPYYSSHSHYTDTYTDKHAAATATATGGPGKAAYPSTFTDSILTRSMGTVTPHGGQYGSSTYAFSYSGTPLGPVPTSRHVTAVTGVSTRYTQAAVTAEEDKAGRPAATKSGETASGVVNVATATGAPQASNNPPKNAGSRGQVEWWGVGLAALAGWLVG